MFLAKGGGIVLVFLWFILFSLAVSLLSYPHLLSFLKSSGGVRKNFRGKTLPTSGGILIIVVMLVSLGLTSLLFKNWLREVLALWLTPLTTLVLGVGFLGMLDDLLGSRAVGGFRGHLGELSRGYLTSGILKALGGGALSLYIASFYSPNLALLIINALLLAFFINTLNLLDLRPGRAEKVFLILGLVAFLFSYRSSLWVIWGIFLPPILILFYTDLKEKCMIGDVGSNILGAILGFTFVVNFEGIPKLLVLALLFLLQVFAERYSITESIKRVSFLKWFDDLGRAPD